MIRKDFLLLINAMLTMMIYVVDGVENRPTESVFIFKSVRKIKEVNGNKIPKHNPIHELSPREQLKVCKNIARSTYFLNNNYRLIYGAPVDRIRNYKISDSRFSSGELIAASRCPIEPAVYIQPLGKIIMVFLEKPKGHVWRSCLDKNYDVESRSNESWFYKFVHRFQRFFGVADKGIGPVRHACDFVYVDDYTAVTFGMISATSFDHQKIVELQKAGQYEDQEGPTGNVLQPWSTSKVHVAGNNVLFGMSSVTNHGKNDRYDGNNLENEVQPDINLGPSDERKENKIQTGSYSQQSEAMFPGTNSETNFVNHVLPEDTDNKIQNLGTNVRPYGSEFNPTNSQPDNLRGNKYLQSKIDPSINYESQAQPGFNYKTNFQPGINSGISYGSNSRLGTEFENSGVQSKISPSNTQFGMNSENNFIQSGMEPQMSYGNMAQPGINYGTNLEGNYGRPDINLGNNKLGSIQQDVNSEENYQLSVNEANNAQFKIGLSDGNTFGSPRPDNYNALGIKPQINYGSNNQPTVYSETNLKDDNQPTGPANMFGDRYRLEESNTSKVKTETNNYKDHYRHEKYNELSASPAIYSEGVANKNPNKINPGVNFGNSYRLEESSKGSNAKSETQFKDKYRREEGYVPTRISSGDISQESSFESNIPTGKL